MRNTITAMGVAALMGFGLVVAAGETAGGAEKAAAAKAAEMKAPAPGKLDIIKKLAGDWVEVGEDGRPTDKVVSTYRVTAGGSAVEETLFAGTDHEMITLYHLDGDDLVLTHYCVAGNQPRMKAQKQVEPNKLVFQCAGGTNMKSENDEHMHHATIVWKDDDHIHSEWQEFKDGKNVFTASFNLARR